ncbi:hypothetical protein [Mycobacteroides abscessus]|uniref:hypothetical protein n=1 Tax=Mycobacteroides abscessus TaxID=36809 RepID=UPI0009299102|nr:hypothetical protein [Mycobacteroides abscessus]SIC20098.1 Uncharacterised protein [Mycobacteroides abscessus subsp. abscessus]
MSDVEGQVLTLESVRAALAADVERDAQSVVAVSTTRSEYSAAVERAQQLYAQLVEQYAQAAAKPYIKDKLAELGITDPAKLAVTIGGAKKSPAKKSAPKNSMARKKPTITNSKSAPSASGQDNEPDADTRLRGEHQES